MAAIDDVKLQETGNRMHAVNFNSSRGIKLKYDQITEFETGNQKKRTSTYDVNVAAGSLADLGQISYYKGGELDVVNYFRKTSADYI